MNLKDLATSPQAMRLANFFSRHTPPRLTYRLAWWAAGLLGRSKPAVYHVLRANLSQVLGPDTDQVSLNHSVRQVFYATLRGYYDLFRALQLPREQLADLVDLSEGSQEVVRSLWNREGGTVVVSLHLGAFDLGGQALIEELPEVQSLTLPEPPPGFEMTNELRRLSGADVTPLSPAALRKALRLLRRGGVLAVAGDRPVSELDEPVLFFGRPARVPSGHVRLALKTGAVIVIAYCALIPETQRYMVFVEPPLEMIRTGDRDEEIQINLRRILDALEAAIRRWPEQWQMYVPVWPEIVEA